MEPARFNWLINQFRRWPIHMGISATAYLFFTVVGSLLGTVFGFQILAVAFAILFMMAGFAFGLEFGQNQMKIEYGNLDKYDLLDSVYDWVSWVLPAAILTVVIFWRF